MNRPRTQTLIATSALGLALVAVPALPAAASDGGPTKTTDGSTTVIKVREVETGGAFVPKGGEPQDFPEEEDFEPSVGDRFTFISDLFQGSTKVGTSSGGCTFLTVDVEEESSTNDCDATYTFADGTLRLADQLEFSEDSGTEFTVKIVSGTGAYRGAGGTARIVEQEDEDEGEGDGQAPPAEVTLTFTTDRSRVSQVPSGGAATGGGALGDTSDSAGLIALGALAGLAGLGVLAGGRRLAVNRR